MQRLKNIGFCMVFTRFFLVILSLFCINWRVLHVDKTLPLRARARALQQCLLSHASLSLILSPWRHRRCAKPVNKIYVFICYHSNQFLSTLRSLKRHTLFDAPSCLHPKQPSPPPLTRAHRSEGHHLQQNFGSFFCPCLIWWNPKTAVKRWYCLVHVGFRKKMCQTMKNLRKRSRKSRPQGPSRCSNVWCDLRSCPQSPPPTEGTSRQWLPWLVHPHSQHQYNRSWPKSWVQDDQYSKGCTFLRHRLLWNSWNLLDFTLVQRFHLCPSHFCHGCLFSRIPSFGCSAMAACSPGNSLSLQAKMPCSTSSWQPGCDVPKFALRFQTRHQSSIFRTLLNSRPTTSSPTVGNWFQWANTANCAVWNPAGWAIIFPPHPISEKKKKNKNTLGL